MKRNKKYTEDPRKDRLNNLLGQKVHVVIDRPIGYDHNGLVYPINYGYVPGMMGGDGEEQDAYILGVDTPLTEFDGWVIGGVRRTNDEEDKLIVAPEYEVFSQAEIAEATYFQEQFFESFVVSIFRKSCGVVPYRDVDGKREFLIIRDPHDSGFWGFPKGHMEVCETELDTAARELMEEVGLEAQIEPETRTAMMYPLFCNRFGKKVQKQVVFFRGKVTGEPILNPDEVSAYKWATEEELWEHLLYGTAHALQNMFK